MPTKTYAECEQEIKDRLSRVSQGYKNYPMLSDRMAFESGVLFQIAVELRYENELLRDTANTAEMHALHDKLAGVDVNEKQIQWLRERMGGK